MTFFWFWLAQDEGMFWKATMVSLFGCGPFALLFGFCVTRSQYLPLPPLPEGMVPVVVKGRWMQQIF